ncbi:MAG: DUF1592 domain-containing protein [Bryobacterales bacterium]|nr:DUF1592 domain-containing protein [Bryobacterales bacterium]
MPLAAFAAPPPVPVESSLTKHCSGCHSGAGAKNGLDLSSLQFNLADRATRERWVRIHDRVEKQEMPPKGVPFDARSRAAILDHLRPALDSADRADAARNGRGPLRRLNRDEYEQNLRDLLALPHLDIRDMLPEDREAYHFNKVSETLDMSRVQLAAYLDAAEAALRQAMATTAAPPPVTTFRTNGFRLFPGLRSTGGIESMFFIKDNKGVNVEREYARPLTPELEKDQEIEMGLFRSPGWPYGAFPRGFAAPHAGRYRVRFQARAVLQHGGYRVSQAKSYVPMTFRSRRPTNHDIAEDVKLTGGIQEILEPRVYETTVLLAKGQTIEYGLLGNPVPQVDAIPSKPGSYRFPPFPAEGQPGIAMKWIEIEGPLPPEAWPPASHRVLFDEMGPSPVSTDPKRDASKLLRRFIALAARGPVPDEAIGKFERLVHARLDKNQPFAEALLEGYQAFLCSGLFLYLHEPVDDFAIAQRLSHFLANTRPDAALLQLARGRRLRDAAVLRSETSRLIASEGFDRFVKSFTDYWLNLRHLRRDDPDKRLYPEYPLDEYLVDSMERETRTYFATMIRENLPARMLVDSDFVFANDRLSRHYDLSPVTTTTLQRVKLPAGSPLGGMLTQGAILKLTANGTSTSPVLRGAWIMDRIIGEPPPPPPPGVPAVEPDIRGAKTIREQLALHTKSAACASCHAKFDPVGLALENFDILGKWRTRYRGLAEGDRISGIDHTGHDYSYTLAGAIDASGTLADGRMFRDVRELKALFAGNARQLARNMLHQFAVYATGTPIRFSDRGDIEKILDTCSKNHYRVRDLMDGLIQSRIFLGGQ